jgi:hypothetical protein
MAAEMRRQRKEMRLIALTLGLVLVVSAALVVSHLRHSGRASEASAPAPQLPLAPVTNAPTASGQLTPPSAQYPPAQTGAPSGASRSHGPQAVKVENLPPVQQSPSAPINRAQTPSGEAIAEGSPSLPETPSTADASSGSDRYPGSEPIKVDVSLPNIGIPVATEVYSTSDSVSAVISYYKQRYPDATVTDVEGQRIIAVSGPAGTKAIAVGTTGSETRIAIVQPK